MPAICEDGRAQCKLSELGWTEGVDSLGFAYAFSTDDGRQKLRILYGPIAWRICGDATDYGSFELAVDAAHEAHFPARQPLDEATFKRLIDEGQRNKQAFWADVRNPGRTAALNEPITHADPDWCETSKADLQAAEIERNWGDVDWLRSELQKSRARIARQATEAGEKRTAYNAEIDRFTAELAKANDRAAILELGIAEVNRDLANFKLINERTKPVVTLDRIDLYRRTLVYFGPRTQCLKAFEEGGEYLTALARVLAGEGHRADILGEIADVRITSEQMALLCGFSLEQLQEEIDRKLARLACKIGERTDSGTR